MATPFPCQVKSVITLHIGRCSIQTTRKCSIINLPQTDGQLYPASASKKEKNSALLGDT